MAQSAMKKPPHNLLSLFLLYLFRDSREIVFELWLAGGSKLVSNQSQQRYKTHRFENEITLI